MKPDPKTVVEISHAIGNGAFLGSSPVFLAAIRAIERIANCDATTLVQGETGTGKELAARAVHYLSARRDHPFVPVNCGAIPDGLFESELFGHSKGAFTDAKDSNLGLVAHAEGGTLFLDEIECLSPQRQVMLLRFLQDQLYRPIGGRPRAANVRVVAAGNQDLAQMMQAGEFRHDLYYRLALLTLTMPPLRERVGDPELLALHFIATGSQRFRVPAKPLHSSAIEWFDGYRWPGNVRELENLIYREIILSEAAEIRIDSALPGGLAEDRRRRDSRRTPSWSGMPYRRAKSIALKDFEQWYLVNLLTQTRGNVTAAARLAGKERRSFGRLLQKNGIDKIPFRS